MRELFRMLKKTIASNEAAVLVTIVADGGSVPRGSGAGMLVTGQGRIAGTIGGGAVEFECIKLAHKCLENKCSAKEFFRLRSNEIADIGMVCGGDVDIFFKYIEAGDEYFLRLSETVGELFNDNRQSWLITRIDEDNNGTMSVYSGGNVLVGDELPSEVIEGIMNGSSRVETGSVKYYIERLVRAGRVFVFGGGHVSQQLVPILSRCDFSCTVVEDRPEFARPELFENRAANIMLINMDDIGELVPAVTADDYICIMTRGHRDDYLVQYQMLKTPACYIGVIGSRHKKESVNARLKADGYSEEDLQRITTPIGLDIHSETPAEIAVSIAAQLIEVRAGRE